MSKFMTLLSSMLLFIQMSNSFNFIQPYTVVSLALLCLFTFSSKSHTTPFGYYILTHSLCNYIEQKGTIYSYLNLTWKGYIDS